MSAAKPSLLASTAQLALFSTVCVAGYHWHNWTRIRRLLQKPKKKNGKDTREKLVVITGCDRGLGRLLAEHLHETTGYLVVALTLTESAAQELNEAGVKHGSSIPGANEHQRLYGVRCDVTRQEDVDQAAAFVEDLLDSKFRNNAVLYALINNAGIADPGDFLFFNDVSVFEKVLQVNFMGQIRVTQAFLPLMLRTSRTLPLNESARILNMSSVCGASASPSNGSYNASKFAVEAWSDSLRLELESFDIQVVKIRPGQISTDIQTDWPRNFIKNFDAAPAFVQNLYGGKTFRDRVHSSFQPMLEGQHHGGMSDASLVSNSVRDMLELPTLRPMYWIGADANTLWKALASLPTNVADSLKRLIHSVTLPHVFELPPTEVVSHVTIDVSSLEKALPFYLALGFKIYGEPHEGQQFLKSGGSAKSWSTLVLLRENPSMKQWGGTWEAGMTRVCILTPDLNARVQELRQTHGLEPMASPANTPNGKLAAFRDPDGMVVYLIQFVGILGSIVRSSWWWNSVDEPALFQLTVNVTDKDVGLAIFDALGFKKVYDLTEQQASYDMLPAFGIEEKGSLIKYIRGCKLPNDALFSATVMQWINPETARTGRESQNALTISVDDVAGALDRAEKAGMSVKHGPVYKTFPVFGEVLVASAFVELGSCTIEFCSFANRKS